MDHCTPPAQVYEASFLPQGGYGFKEGRGLRRISMCGHSMLLVQNACYMMVVLLPVSNHGDEWWAMVKPMAIYRKHKIN